nr:MAG TPA: hypothetical protein [Myoviridae sp. ctNPX13]
MNSHCYYISRQILRLIFVLAQEWVLKQWVLSHQVIY